MKEKAASMSGKSRQSRQRRQRNHKNHHRNQKTYQRNRRNSPSTAPVYTRAVLPRKEESDAGKVRQWLVKDDLSSTQYPSWFGLWGPFPSDYPCHVNIDWRTWIGELPERFTDLDLDRPIEWHVPEEELPPPSLESKAYDTLASRGKVTRTQNRFSRGLWGALQCSEPGYLDHGWYLWVAMLGVECADQRRALVWIAPEEKLGMEHAD